MANEVTSLKCGDKTYYISQDGEDVYFDRDKKTGGIRLRGIKFKNNILQRVSDDKTASGYDICQAIEKSLK